MPNTIHPAVSKKVATFTSCYIYCNMSAYSSLGVYQKIFLRILRKLLLAVRLPQSDLFLISSNESRCFERECARNWKPTQGNSHRSRYLSDTVVVVVVVRPIVDKACDDRFQKPHSAGSPPNINLLIPFSRISVHYRCITANDVHYWLQHRCMCSINGSPRVSSPIRAVRTEWSDIRVFVWNQISKITEIDLCLIIIFISP